jgi:hypothetical protein
MDPEQVREYGSLEDAVTRKLRHHVYIDDSHLHHVFQYLILPSFEPSIAWDVFRQWSQELPDKHVLIRTCWRSDLDQEKLRTPVERTRHPYPLTPTIEVHELMASSGELEQLAHHLEELELPIGATRGVIGCDGVTFEVAIETNARSARCRLSWWCEPPEAWRGLRGWISRAEDVFETAWLARTNASERRLQVVTVNDEAARVEARRLFREGHYGRVTELLVEIAARAPLSPAETKMLEMSLQRNRTQQ